MVGVVVSGGTVDVDFLAEKLSAIAPGRIYGVDRGLEALDAAGAVPDCMLGDFDSCSPDTVDRFKARGIQVLEYPPEKDMTDTQLAFEQAVSDGVKRLYVFGWNGSRLDHAMGAIFTAEKYMHKLHIIFMDPSNRVFITAKGAVIERSGYRYVSLLPLTDKVAGVTAKGFKYPLERVDMVRQDTFGVSNELVSDVGHVFFESGVLCIIQSKD